MSFLTIFEKLMLVKLQVKLATQYSAAFFQHIFKLPMMFYEQRYSSEIAYRSTLNQEVADFITGSMLETLVRIFEVIVFGVVLFIYSPIIAFVGILCGCLNLITISIMHNRRLGVYAQYQQEMGKTAAFSISALEGFETWKCLGCENKLFSWLAALYTRTFNILHRLRNIDVILANMAAFSYLAANTALFVLGGWFVIQGTLTPGQFLALFLLMSGFLLPIINLVEINQNFELFRIDVARLDDVMRYPIDWRFTQKKCISVKNSVIENIEIRDVTYRYNPTQPPILKSINLSIKKGDCIGLVGAIGSGKTTIQKLLAGFISPESGEILIDKVALKDYPPEFLSSQMAFIFAESFIFAETLRKNVTLYDTSISDEKIKKAMIDACLWERFFEEKLDTVLEEEGRNISGGERQRVEIARCLVRDPSFIILDEATSSLDEATEMNVLNNIKKRGCTMLMLTHRLSAINLCDVVYVIDQGIIVQKGTPQELTNEDGLFKKMLIVEKEQ
jgi:ABC-type bacteriocin/lantibiotic exporter with double-glycine peptidase domain